MSGIVLKITIEDTHPPVWRRLVVPENISFYDLHRVIQLVFGWEDMHMHIFEAPQNRFEIVANSKDAYTDFFMEKKLPVSAVAEHENWIRYVYGEMTGVTKLYLKKYCRTMKKILLH